MNLPQLSIKRPVLATMCSALMILFGLISYESIPLARFPTIDFPMVSITTVMQGASPEIIDASVTNTLETAVNAVPGIDHLTSYTRPSRSRIIIKFDLNKNIDVAFNEVQAKVNQVISTLPESADTPVVEKLEVGGTPIMQVVLTGNRTLQQLNLLANHVVKKKLETIDGVGQVNISGERKRTIRIELRPQRLAAYDLVPSDVLQAIKSEHVQVPGGFMVGKSKEYLLNLDLEYHSARTLKDLIITYHAARPIRLSDIATIQDGLADDRELALLDGKEAVGLGIIKVSGANTVKIIQEVKKRLATEIRPALPQGVQLTVASDEANIIQDIIDALTEHLVVGTLFATFVVFFFLQNLRSTLIIALTIPISLLGAIAVIYLAGFSFNLMTLLGLLLLIGVVVDDAIVVLENIYRRQLEYPEESRVESALKGTEEVMFAVLAATLTLVAIFVPVIFLGGIVGRFFKSFAIVVSSGVIISYLVSLSLTPQLCSAYLRHGKTITFLRPLQQSLEQLDTYYKNLVTWLLNHRWSVIGLVIALVLSSGLIFKSVTKEFLPPLDEGQFIINFKTPLGANISYTKEKLIELESRINHYPEVTSIFSQIGGGINAQVNQGSIFVSLSNKADRTKSQRDIIQQVRNDLAGIPGVQAYPAEVSIVGGGRGEPLQFVLRGNNLQGVQTVAQKFLTALSEIPNLGYVDLDLKPGLPQYTLTIDRERAQSLGIKTADVANAITVLAGGINVAKYNDLQGDGDRYDIRLKSTPGELRRKADLSQIYLRARDGKPVRIDTIAKLTATTGPAVIFRSNLQYGGMFFSSPGISLGQAVSDIKQLSKKLLPPGYSLHLEGQAKEFQSTAKYISFTLLLAVSLVYMVLASQFNSYIQPLVIMIAQPLAIIGAVFALWISGQSLNIYSMIGMVLLMGLVAKNAILLVELTNEYRHMGDSISNALTKACPQRMRPVLMTSFTVILAMLPAATGHGAGSDSNGPLATAVIGGMISSTFLTLIVVPALYSLVEHAMLKFSLLRHDQKDSNRDPNEQTQI